MAHLHRFYAEHIATGGGEAELTGAEAHHALHVVRVRSGDRVALFDGSGGEVQGEVTRTTRDTVFVRIGGTRQSEPPSVRLTLIQAGLHRERAMESLVRRGVEIGVTQFHFFRAQRSERTPKVNTKWQRWAIESCKQCGRLWLPSFAVAASLAEALDATECDALLLAAQDAEAAPLSALVKGPHAALIIGSEGDFTDEERAVAQARGAIAINLGTATLRSEVAAFAGAALVLYELGELGPRG